MKGKTLQTNTAINELHDTGLCGSEVFLSFA